MDRVEMEGGGWYRGGIKGTMRIYGVIYAG